MDSCVPAVPQRFLGTLWTPGSSWEQISQPILTNSCSLWLECAGSSPWDSCSCECLITWWIFKPSHKFTGRQDSAVLDEPLWGWPASVWKDCILSLKPLWSKLQYLHSIDKNVILPWSISNSDIWNTYKLKITYFIWIRKACYYQNSSIYQAAFH